MLSAAAKGMIADAMESAPRGRKKREAMRLAEMHGCSVATVYRAAERGGSKKSREVARPEYRDAVRVAVDLAHRGPEPAPLDLALESACAAGLVSSEKIPPLSTAHRIAREEGLRPGPRRTRKLAAEYPMRVVLVDGTTSRYLSVGDPLDDAETDWELHPTKRISARGYKNKPLAAHRLRLVIYGIWDRCTGYARCAALVARGETALDQMETLCLLLEETGDPRRPLHGRPDEIWSDNGAWCKSGPTRDLMERLEIDIGRGEPYAKERMGGVERPWRTLWARFERSLYLRADPHAPISLSELRERLAEFERRENGRRLSRTNVAGRPASRAAAWVALTNARPAGNPLRRMPERAIETLAREARRRIDRNGILRWGGVEYETPWHDCWAIARRPLDGDGAAIVVEREDTGEREFARPWEPLPAAAPAGAYRASPTALDRLLKEAPASGAGADPYASREIPAAAPMRPRSGEAAPLENPLDAGRCRDLAEAMALFAEIYGRMPRGPARERIAEELLGRGLTRRGVADLAAELSALGRGAGGAA